MASKRRARNYQLKRSKERRNLEKCITMTKKNPKTINDYLDGKYGKDGTESRGEFKQKAQAYMVAELVKEARKKAKLTQEELAQKVHLKRPHISRIERAETDVRISTLQKIAQGLGGNLSISFDV